MHIICSDKFCGTHKYCVVLFQEDQSVEVVYSGWLRRNESVCSEQRKGVGVGTQVWDSSFACHELFLTCLMQRIV